MGVPKIVNKGVDFCRVAASETVIPAVSKNKSTLVPWDYTFAALEDGLVRVLSSMKTADVIEEKTSDGWCKIIHIHRMYLEQAEVLLYRINVYSPLPEFIIFKEDIPDRLAKALESLGKVAMKQIITNSVRRLYEAVDPDYFHSNGIYGKVKWRISK